MDKLLVLDLDNTLLHCHVGRDGKVPNIKIDDGYHITFRPHARTFIKEMQKIYRVGVWTASTRDYATAVVNVLFQGLRPPEFLNSREDCVMVKEFTGLTTYKLIYSKPLEMLNHRHDHIVILDDAVSTLHTNPLNTIIIDKWEVYDEHDVECGLLCAAE